MTLLIVLLCIFGYFTAAGIFAALVRSQTKDKGDETPFLIGILWPVGGTLWVAWFLTERFLVERKAKKEVPEKNVDAATYRSVE